MKRGFYLCLAVSNIRKNAQTYLPYIVASALCIGMFFIMYSLHLNPSITEESITLASILFFGMQVVGFFCVIFIFYTNSFLIKRRKKEFGLFNILGMEKQHIAKLISIETLLVTVLAIFLGLTIGIIFSKLTELVLLKILTFPVNIQLDISIPAMGVTTALFAGVFALTLITNLYQVIVSKPIELLSGGQVGEKEPKSRWIITTIGILALGGGYVLSQLHIPAVEAVFIFFAAVILVIVGTYCLFISGSITLLKRLKKNKAFYYKPKNFISVSGMVYRMKQNGVGLANICILSTIVLVMISATLSLYIGVDDLLANRYPKDVAVEARDADEETVAQINGIVDERLNAYNLNAESIMAYQDISLFTNIDGNKFQGNPENEEEANIAFFRIFDLDSYNNLTGENVILQEGELLASHVSGPDLDTQIILGDTPYDIKLVDNFYEGGGNDTSLSIIYYLVASDVQEVQDIYSAIFPGSEGFNGLTYHYSFDIEADEETTISFIHELDNALKLETEHTYAVGPLPNRENFYLMYGGLFFLGLFLGLLFIIITVLIMYYKQVTEGYDDKLRFEIMQKVGLSHSEVKQAIKRQVIIVFFLPLVAAGIHIIFAFNLITIMLTMFELTNTTLFALCNILVFVVFAIFYGIVYAITARVYYKIVS